MEQISYQGGIKLVKLTADHAIAINRTEVHVLPENFWGGEVWHDAPCRGPMRRLKEALVLSEEISIPLWECVGCGAKVYAGLDEKRRVVHYPWLG